MRWGKCRRARWLPLRTMSLNKTSPFCPYRIIDRKTVHWYSCGLWIVFATNNAWSTSNAIFSKRFPFRPAVSCLRHGNHLRVNSCVQPVTSHRQFDRAARWDKNDALTGNFGSLLPYFKKLWGKNKIAHGIQHSLNYKMITILEIFFFHFINTLMKWTFV